jgi:quercetin dioxygenase-like cupin family protein
MGQRDTVERRFSDFRLKPGRAITATGVIAMCGLLGLIEATAAAAPPPRPAKVTVVFDQPLPNVPGKSLKGVLVEYPPGGSSPGHTHAASAFIYATVLSGEIRSSVNDAPVQTYKAGQNFYETPGAHHGVSANASRFRPASLLAVFVVDSSEKVLTTNDPR